MCWAVYAVTIVARLKTCCIMLRMTFIPHREATALRVCGAGMPERTVAQFAHERAQKLDAWLNDHTDNGTRTKPRPARTTVQEWRDTRTHDAVIARLMGTLATPHTRTRAHVHKLTLSNGSIVTTTSGDTHAEARAIARGVIEARRQARRYRRAMLRTAYRGTLTRDGMSIGTSDPTMRLAQLDRAIALSDAFLYRHGDTFAMPQLMRNAIRHDDGTVDAASTLLAARLRHTRRVTT
jgi:hypothetical protein